MSEGCHRSAPPEDQPRFSHSGSGGIITVGSGSNGSSGLGSNSAGSSNSNAGNTPTDPPKTPRQMCKEQIQTNYSKCKAQAAGNYSAALKGRCRGLGSVTAEGNAVIVSGSVTIYDYGQCKDEIEADRDAAYYSCDVVKNSRTQRCP